MDDRIDGQPVNMFVMSDDPRVAGLNPPEPSQCGYCGSLLYTKGIFYDNRVVWMPYGPEPCQCQAAKDAAAKAEVDRAANEAAIQKRQEALALKIAIRRIIGESGMGNRFLQRTFDTFQVTRENKSAAQTAKRYAGQFDSLLPEEGRDKGHNGLFIAGPKGTGKTHLAAAIANHLIHKGTPVICMTMIDLLERIKRTFNTSDAVDETEVLRIYKTVPLLIIDDMGKEQPTDWAISTIYNIINGRYEAMLPIIITTNYDDKALIARMTPKGAEDSITAEATVDRLMEMCKAIVMTGASWRTR